MWPLLFCLGLVLSIHFSFLFLEVHTSRGAVAFCCCFICIETDAPISSLVRLVPLCQGVV